MRKISRSFLVFICLMWAGLAGAATLSQEDAVSQALSWMSGNPVMSKVNRTVGLVSTFSGEGTYFVYVVELSPKGYLILNSDNRLPLIVAFSADSGVNLSDDPQNALRAMLLDYCERMEQTLSEMSLLPVAMADEATGGGDELYGPFLETSWNQNDPYNLFCPETANPIGSSYDGRVPVGCVPVAFAQILNFHRWPAYGTSSRSYTDSEGSLTGLHNADFSDVYDWRNMKTAHSAADSAEEQAAVGELMFELGVVAEANFEAGATSSSQRELASRLGTYAFFESVDCHSSQTDLIAPMEADLRAGFPCVVSYPGHAFVSDGLMVDGGMTTYHLNMGWGGANNGWYSKDLVPTAQGGSSYLDDGVTSLRPQLMAFPETNSVSATAGGSAELRWILPKRREGELAQLNIKRLEQQIGTWSSDASEINGLNSGWEISSGGYSGDCWYSEQSADRTGSDCLLLNEVFVPDASANLTFRRYAKLYMCSFYIEVSTDGGHSYDELYAVEDPYESSWSYHAVSLAAYAGQQIRLRFRVDSDGGYYDGMLPGIRLDNLAVTSGEWYDWELFETDSTLASRRFSSTNTLWDDCDDFSGFSVYSTSSPKEWAITNVTGVGSCFGIEPDGYGGTEYVTSIGTITPSSSTRLVLVAKYYLSSDPFRILVSTDGSSFTELWSATGSLDWGDIKVDLSAYAGQAIYVRLEYVPGSYYPDGGGVWIDSISTQEVTNPELEGQPIYTTTLTDLIAGTNTLAVTLTDTNLVEHAVGPAFTLAVAANAADQDLDSLPNWWEEQYFGGTTNAVTNAVAANGVNTVLEAYIAGLNPTNPASLFEAALTNQSQAGFVVQWNAVSGRVYSVYGSTTLPDGFQPLETNILWPQNSWTDTVERAGSFYKVDVELE